MGITTSNNIKPLTYRRNGEKGFYMTNLDVSAIITACDTLAHRIITIGGERHGSAYIFDKCMRLFDNRKLPAQAVTFSVFLNAPVMADGEATIYNDGRLEIRRV